jgi:hypothetical protein
LWEKLEIDPEPRVSRPEPGLSHGAHHATGDADVVAYVDGRETFVGPMPRLLESLGLTSADLE